MCGAIRKEGGRDVENIMVRHGRLNVKSKSGYNYDGHSS